MANIASQKKRIARTERERQENLRFASSVKTHIKRLEKAVESGDDSAADTEHQALISRIDKAIQKGAMHKNTGARKKARAARIRAGEVSAPAAKPAAKAAAAPAPEADAEDADAGSSDSED